MGRYLSLKNMFCSSFTLLLFSMPCSAQDAKFGIKGGLNLATITGDFTEGINPRLSGHIGIFVNYEFSDKLSFQPELLYSSQGFRFNTDLAFIESGSPSGNETDFTSVLRQNYISIPIIAQFRLSDRIALEFGPQIAFLLNEATVIKNFDGIDAQNLNERESRSGNFRLDYGAAVGFLIDITEALSISPRLFLGLRNLTNGQIGDPENNNLVLQLSMNYTFL